jgi:hypothetical protein
MPKIDVAKSILNHPDKDEILSKLTADVSPIDISEGLAARYSAPSEKKFALTTKAITTFKKDYLDIYSIIQDDLATTKSNLTASEEITQEIQGSFQYHKALERYVDNEIDIKTTVKKMVANIELRASQVFDDIQNDTQNTRNDRILREWFDSLLLVLEKYDSILNPINPEQVNIQNNINIQVVDNHINSVYNVVKNILEKLDYDTSILFIDMFNEEMGKLKSTESPTILPQQERMETVKILSETITTKLTE